MSNIIIITGQTATGKTKKALQIASEVNGELINCDSRQIYKKLDIVTGKDITEKNFVLDRKINGFDVGYYALKIPKPKFQIINKSQTPNPKSSKTNNPSKILRVNQQPNNQVTNKLITIRQSLSVPLWLYDVVDPKLYFSSYDYKILALDVISDILKRGKTPIIVGGAGYYLYHLLYDIPTSGIPQDWELRRSLSGKGTEELRQEYENLDPKAFVRLNNSEKNNTQRLIRRIEIAYYQKDDKKVQKNSIKNNLFHLLHLSPKNIVIYPYIQQDKTKLKEKIMLRVDSRLEQGAIEETKSLLDGGYTAFDPGLKTIGYQQIISYLKGCVSINDMKEVWITKEIQYAKRQATFLKKYIMKSKSLNNL